MAKVSFPSLEFFQALQASMGERQETFRRLGFFDTTFGVRVLAAPGGASANSQLAADYVLSFEVFDCTGVRETSGLSTADVDFILEADASVWGEMLSNIKEKGGADVEHGINTLTHFGDRMRVLYEDPDDHDKMFRFAESIQEFFDLAAGLDIEFSAADEGARASA
jgi:hypothetical protein